MCAVHLLESCRGFWIVEILVRVVDSCKASVGTLDLLVSGRSFDLQSLIVVECCGRRHLATDWHHQIATNVSGNYRRDELLERKKRQKIYSSL